jgi:nucleotidyltransferase substrate binding protein (TIGR01987 family)
MNDQDVRWKQRFDNLQADLRRLRHAVEANAATPGNDLIQMALIKAFEMTFELSWKTMKDYLNYNGIAVKLPREVLKQAFANDIVTDGQVWIDMLEDRNLMAHTYDEARALEAVNHICQRYMAGLEQLHQYLHARSA